MDRAGSSLAEAAEREETPRLGRTLPNPNALGGDAAAGRPGTVRQQLAAETLRLYASDWAHFQKFCAERGKPALPASPDLVATYLAASGPGRAALARRLAAIDHRHRRHGLTPPGDDKALRSALKQARKIAARRPRPPALVPASLEQLAESCRGDLAGRRDRALLLLAAAGLGRAALVGLQAERVRFFESGLELDRGGGSGGAPDIVARSPALDRCPVRALEDWLRLSGTRYGPVFRKVNRWGRLEHQGLRTDAVRVILARHAATISPDRGRR